MSRDHFVYRAFNAEGELLYVGCTKRPQLRWAEHKTMRPRMVAETARFKVQGPYTREVARSIEHKAIRSEEPLYGWTPSKNAEKHQRTKWIDQQYRALVENGMDWPVALTTAVAAAEEHFPDPDAHERAEATA